MANEEANLTNAEIRNHIEYSLKILASMFDDKIQNLESTISNLNNKIELLTQRIEFLERSGSTKQVNTSPRPTPIHQEPTKPKKPEKASSSLSDALRLIEE